MEKTNVIQLADIVEQRCGGYEGHWACESEYPDHYVPLSQFHRDGDGYQASCKKCVAYRDADPRGNPYRNAVSAEAHRLAGGKEFYEAAPVRGKQRKEWRMQAAENIRSRAESALTALGSPVAPTFDDGRPRKRSVSKSRKKPSERSGRYREGPGYVYVYQDERLPDDLKIGSSKYDHGRISQAGTWGCYRCIFQMKFDRRYEAEDKVHKLLAEYRLYSNKELFKVDVETAKQAILKVKAES